MAVYQYRSQNESLNEGTTDGKYRKVRPNTTVAPGLGDEIVRANRKDLHAFYNYGMITAEELSQVSPGATDVKVTNAARAYRAPSAYISNYMTNDQNQ
ncbi:hypothetical protein UFOVP621_112 [uncultured Caudovirales phage]|uniref:Uncharacterized protein n=1 Tax=uncultured Caudovirales phage TaxID=2100421 RepID=A0A6J5N7F9_9CAUD|nr:hypothetical protein UFOVP621_112 [uncultured Caudovirales phage]